MKKILSISAVILAVMLSLTSSVFAEAPVEDDSATICFDDSSFLNEWLSEGAIDAAGLSYKVGKDSYIGDGALVISQNITKAVPEDERFGGIYIESESLGLDSFKGCIVEANVRIDTAAAEYIHNFALYSDGVVWMDSSVSPETKGVWTKVTLAIPENADNGKIGFLIPIYEPYNGNVAFIDEIKITSADGTVIPNVGDMSRSINVEVEKEASLLETIINIAIVVVLVAIVVFCLIAIISRHNKRYK